MADIDKAIGSEDLIDLDVENKDKSINVEVPEDIEIDLSSVFYDVENGANLSFSYSEDVDAMTADLSGSILTLTFLSNQYGSGNVIVSASDVVSRLSIQDSFDVEVNAVVINIIFVRSFPICNDRKF